MAVRVQFRRGTAAEWTSADVVLAVAELGFESDTGLFKIGDGTTSWNSLDYAKEQLSATSPITLTDGDIGLDESSVNIDESQVTGLSTSLAGKQDVVSGVSDTEIGFLSNVTSDIQTQLDSKASTSFVQSEIADLVNSAPAALDTLNELAAALDDDPNFATTVTNELATKQDTVAGVSDTEIGYLDGVTSGIQSQIDSKADTTYVNNELATKQDTVSGVSDTEIGYLNGVTSGIQSQINGKEDNITGGASSITSSNLTTNRALISDGSGKVSVSAVTSTELSRLDGVTSSVQSQLNGKANLSGANFSGRVTASDSVEARFSVRNTYISTGDPSGGTDGDIWLKYE